MISNHTWFKKKISHINEKTGSISIVESGDQIPFDIKRAFYLTDINIDEVRGAHAHEELQQFILCLSGTFDIRLEGGSKVEIINMKNDAVGLFVGGMVWRDMFNFSKGAVMLVLCDKIYSEDIVIRNYEKFKMHNKK
ncbi:MAG: FdtA/QdtA family cupin domain-containing protein [Pseudomonadales bacterium]|nr:FdtA/QdtA family cupin domain-containing protein [Pseudomonadales bacterium]